MPTYEDFYRLYAQRIRDAIRRDRFYRYYISIDQLRRSHTLVELKNIKREIDTLVYEGSDKHLSDEHKEIIYRGLSQELGFSTSQSSVLLCRSASNDDLTELVQLIEVILRGGK